jgi:hypothetical protein
MGDAETSAIIARKRAQESPAPAASVPVSPTPATSASPPVVAVVPRRLREIAGPNPAAVDVWQFLGLDRAHRLRLMADLTTRPPPRRYSGPASRLDQAFRSILGAAQVVGFARRGQRAELVAAIVEGLGLDVEIVMACIDDPSGEPFAILLKVLGLDNIQAQQVFLLATPSIGRDVTAFFSLTDVYASMEKSVAEILVAAWRGDLAGPPRHAPVFAPGGARRPAGSPIGTSRDQSSETDDKGVRGRTG